MSNSFLVVLFALLCVFSQVRAQGACFPSTLTTYSANTTLQTTTISWVADCIAQTITFTVSDTSNTWVGFGLGGTGVGMQNMDIVQGGVVGGNSTVLDRFSTFNAAIATDPISNIRSASATFLNGITTVTWTRDWNTNDTTNDRPIVPGQMNFIRAVGATIDFNGGHSFLPAGRALGATTFIPAASSTTGAASANCPAGTTISPNPVNLDGAVGNAIVRWTITCDLNEIEFTFTGKNPSGWVAMGLNTSPTRTMVNSDIYMANLDNNNQVVVSDRFAIGFATPIADTTSNIISSSGSVANGAFTFTFKRKLDTADSQDVAIVNGNMFVLWAFGPGQDVNVKHTERGGIQIDLFSGGAVAASNIDGRAAHGILMLFAWSLFILISTQIARYLKDIGALWFQIHTALGYLVLILTVASFIEIIVVVRGYFARAHHIIGAFVVAGTIAQPILGVLADKLYDPGRTKTPIFPDIVHQMVGRLTILLGVINIFLGFCNYGANRAVWAIYAVWLAIVITLSIVSNFVVGQVNHNNDVEMKSADVSDAKPHIDEDKLRKAKILTIVFIVLAFAFNIVIAALIPTLQKESLCSGTSY